MWGKTVFQQKIFVAVCWMGSWSVCCFLQLKCCRRPRTDCHKQLHFQCFIPTALFSQSGRNMGGVQTSWERGEKERGNGKGTEVEEFHRKNLQC